MQVYLKVIVYLSNNPNLYKVKMKFIILKYRIELRSIFLAIYLLSLIAGIFHYHHFEFSNDASIETEQNNYSNHFQFVIGGNYECIIQHNLNNLQTALLFQFSDFSFVTAQNISHHNLNCLFRIHQVHLTDNLLRAPPSLS